MFRLAKAWPWIFGGAALVLHLFRLTAEPYLSGWDGYFYLVQLKALHEEGAMHSPDASPIYPLLQASYAIFGDYELSFQVVSALLAGAFSSLTYLLTRQLTRSTGAALLAALWTLASPSLIFFTANFPKNLLGIDLLLLFSWLHLRRSRWQWLAGIGAGWAHRLTLGLVALWSALRWINWRVWVIGGLGVVTLLSLGLMQGGLHWSDFERFDGAVTFLGDIPHRAFIALMEVDAIWKMELVIGGGLTVLGGVLWGQKKGIWSENRRFWGAWMGILAFLFLPIWRMEAMGMGYRFFLAGLLLVPVVIAGAVDSMGGMARRLAVIGLGIFVWAVQGQFSLTPYQPDYTQFALISDQVEETLADQAPELIIGHKTMAEMVTFRTGIDVLPWQPEYEVDDAKLWRISVGLLRSDFRLYLSPTDQKRIFQLTPTYFLLPESLWQQFRDAATEADDDEMLERILDDLNPHKVRPGYLLRK